MAIAIGTKAPYFGLFNTERKEVTLNDFAGKILVMNFFPAAFTGVCTEQVCTNRDELSFYNDIGATVVGISVDMPFSLKAFKEIKGVAKRGVVVIDKNGVVAYSEETANTGTQVNFNKLKEELKKLAANYK